MRNEPSETGYPELFVIVGSGRSGTKFLAQKLRQSMDIGFSSEPKFVVPTYERLETFGDLSDEANLRRLVEHVHRSKPFRHLRQRVHAETSVDEIVARVDEPTYRSVLFAAFGVIAEKRGCARLGWKDPLDTFHMPLLAELIPSARFIHIVRDGRDVALSLRRLDWGATNVYSGGRYWAGCVATARRDGRMLGPERYHEVRFEDLIRAPEETARRVGRYVNRGENPDQVDAFVDNVAGDADPGRAEAWRREMSDRERYLCEAAAGEMLRRYGYELTYDGEARVSRVVAAYHEARHLMAAGRNAIARRLKRLSGRGRGW